MKVVKPPHSLVSNRLGNLSIFLAGSIEMGEAEDWQSKVEKYFEKAVNVQIYNPRRESWDSDQAKDFENPQFFQQVSWELNALDRADAIIMNLLPDTKSPISLLELGLYASSGKLSVVCPKEFWRSGNVEFICERYGIPLFRTLEELLKQY